MKGFSLKRALFSALMGLPALLLTFVSPLLMILPGFYAFVAVAWGPVCVGISVFVSCLCVFVAAGLDLVSWLLLLCTYVPATILLSYHLVRRKPWRNAAAWTAASMGVGLYFLLCLPSLLAGEGPFGEFEAAIALIARQLVEMALGLREEVQLVVGRDLAFSLPLDAFSIPAIEACACLLVQVCAMAASTRKARMKPCDMSNPRYQMRSWLLRLGFIGERFARPRQTLLEPLDGNAAFFDDAGRQKAKEKRQRKKAMALA